jgi:hypothetical protein
MKHHSYPHASGICPQRSREEGGLRFGRGSLGVEPKWEERGYTPAVFVRVANKGVRVYGTWKSIRNFVGNGEVGKERDEDIRAR